VLLIAPDGTPNNEAALDAVFPFSAGTREIDSSHSRKMDFATLAKALETGKYKLYTGSPGAGTADQWEKRLKDENKNAWPKDQGYWDIQDDGQINDFSDEPRLYVGSRVLVNMEIKRKIKSPYRVLAMFENSKLATRGLYLYGFLDTGGPIKKHGDEPGYNLSRPVTEILKSVFDSNLDLLGDVCLQQQRAYFRSGYRLGQQEI
jgi:hypothetical protein